MYQVKNLHSGRSEQWKITFDNEIPNDEELEKICEKVSYLWGSRITKVDEHTVIYEGWID